MIDVSGMKNRPILDGDFPRTRPVIIKHQFYNDENGKSISVIEHADGTLNVRNGNGIEIYDGVFSFGYVIVVLIELIGLNKTWDLYRKYHKRFLPRS